jgi:hypothetical protein
MDQWIASFLTDFPARGALALTKWAAAFRAQEVSKRMRAKIAHASRVVAGCWSANVVLARHS